MSRWIYDAADPGVLSDLNLRLEPGQEFDAPEDWLPSPDPHPVFKPVLVSKPADEPKPAPEE